MLDERGLKSLRSFAVVMLLVISAVTIALAARYMGYNIQLVEGMNIEEIISFSSFSLIMVCLGGVLNTPRKLSNDKKVLIRKKIRPLMIGNLIFMAYIVFSIIVIKNIYFIISSLIMEGVYINIILISRGLYSCGLSDRQKQWREAVNSKNYSIQDSNIFWRFKIWISPIKRLPFKQRNLRFYNVFIFVFFSVLFISKKQLGIVSVIFIVLYIKSCLSILEYILGIYTSMTGVCTGIKEFEESNRSSNEDGINISLGSRSTYWRIYITDFENKREIVYKTHNYPLIADGDEVIVIHGILSKEVILVNGIIVE